MFTLCEICVPLTFCFVHFRVEEINYSSSSKKVISFNSNIKLEDENDTVDSISNFTLKAVPNMLAFPNSTNHSMHDFTNTTTKATPESVNSTIDATREIVKTTTNIMLELVNITTDAMDELVNTTISMLINPSNEPLESTNITVTCHNKDWYYAVIYGVFIGITILLGELQTWVFFHTVTSASTNLHNTMFAHLLRVPMFFFDTNPLGM